MALKIICARFCFALALKLVAVHVMTADYQRTFASSKLAVCRYCMVDKEALWRVLKKQYFPDGAFFPFFGSVCRFAIGAKFDSAIFLVAREHAIKPDLFCFLFLPDKHAIKPDLNFLVPKALKVIPLSVTLALINITK